MNRHHLEDKIIKMDATTDLLEYVLHNIEEMDEDRAVNALLGVKELYRIRYNELWDTFIQVYKLDQYRESTD